MSLQPGEEIGVPEHPVLDDLPDARRELPIREGIEGIRVRDDAGRLVKGADHVLAQGVVDAGLAAHGRVHLGEQRGGHLNMRHAPLITGGGEACHVSDDAAAEGYHRRVAGEARPDQRVQDAGNLLEGLVLLAVRQHQRVDVVPAERLPEAREIKRRHRLVTDHHDLLAGDGRLEQIRSPE